MRLRIVPVIVLAVLASVGGGWEARACSCDPLSPAAALERADVAFVGVVSAVVDAPDRKDPKTVTFRVEGVHKGDVDEVASVRTEASPDSCGIDFVPSERYTVFATSEAGDLTSGICDATASGADLLAGVSTPRPPLEAASAPAASSGGFPLGPFLLVVGGAAAIVLVRRRISAR